MQRSLGGGGGFWKMAGELARGCLSADAIETLGAQSSSSLYQIETISFLACGYWFRTLEPARASVEPGGSGH